LCLEQGLGGFDVCKDIHKGMAGKYPDIFFGHKVFTSKMKGFFLYFSP